MNAINIAQSSVDAQELELDYQMKRFWATGICPLCDGEHGNNAMCQVSPSYNMSGSDF